jgi:hypothetical protein
MANKLGWNQVINYWFKERKIQIIRAFHSTQNAKNEFSLHQLIQTYQQKREEKVR